MRRVMLIGSMVAVMALSGCGISAAQRAELIDRGVEAARIAAEAEARKLLEKAVEKAVDKAIAEGMKPEDVAKLKETLLEAGRKAIGDAGEIAAAKAKKELDERTPPASGGLGGILGILVTIGGNLLNAYMSKREKL